MPTNLYGPGDNYHSENSHVIPALLKRFHDAKINKNSKVIVWGSGAVYREFLHVDDMARACITTMHADKFKYWSQTESMRSHINVGSGSECTISDLAHIIAQVVGYEGEIVWDKSKPDGPPKKLVDSTKIFELGWKPNFSLKDGLHHTYKEFLNSDSKLRLE